MFVCCDIFLAGLMAGTYWMGSASQDLPGRSGAKYSTSFSDFVFIGHDHVLRWCVGALVLFLVGLHFDGLDNFHFLLSGRKKWKLYHPRDTRHVSLIIPPKQVFPNGYVSQEVWKGFVIHAAL